jgi:hypothetical protein
VARREGGREGGREEDRRGGNSDYRINLLEHHASHDDIHYDDQRGGVI